MTPAYRRLRAVISATRSIRCCRAEEAIRFYASIFENAEIGAIDRYRAGEEPDREGTIRYAGFSLEGMLFAAMDSAYDHGFSFNEAVSFLGDLMSSGDPGKTQRVTEAFLKMKKFDIAELRMAFEGEI